MFTAYIEKVFRCTRNILVKSEYIEFEYEYMTHKLYEYKYEYFKNVLEYTSTEYFRPRSGSVTAFTGLFWVNKSKTMPSICSKVSHTNQSV